MGPEGPNGLITGKDLTDGTIAAVTQILRINPNPGKSAVTLNREVEVAEPRKPKF